MLMTDVTNNWSLKETVVTNNIYRGLFFDYIVIYYYDDMLRIHLNYQSDNASHLVTYLVISEEITMDIRVNRFYNSLTSDEVDTWVTE